MSQNKNGYKKTFSLFGGQMEEILVIAYLLFCYLLDQPRTKRIDSFILKWTCGNLAHCCLKIYLGCDFFLKS